MSGRQNGVTKEALLRLPELELHELRELWCRLYKTATAPRLSNDLLMRAVAYRMQELAAGGLPPRAAAPAPADCPTAAANRTAHDEAPPPAKARDAVVAGMAGAKPRGAGPR